MYRSKLFWIQIIAILVVHHKVKVVVVQGHLTLGMILFYGLEIFPCCCDFHVYFYPVFLFGIVAKQMMKYINQFKVPLLFGICEGKVVSNKQHQVSVGQRLQIWSDDKIS